MITRVRIGLVVYFWVGISACKFESGSAPHRQFGSESESTYNPDNAKSMGADKNADDFSKSADGFMESTLTGKITKSENTFFVQIDTSKKVPLDLSTNKITPPAEGATVSVTGSYKSTDNSQLFVVSKITDKKDGL